VVQASDAQRRIAPALPFVAFPLTDTVDVAAAEQTLQQGFPYSSLRPPRRQPFHAASRFVRLRRVGLHAAVSSGYRTSTQDPPEPVYGLVLHLADGGGTRIGLGRKELIVDGGQAALFRVRDPVCDYADDVARLVLRVPAALIRARLGALLGEELLAPPELDQGIDLTRNPGAAFLRLLRFMLDEIDRDPRLLEAPSVAASWEDLLLTTLLARLHGILDQAGAQRDLAPWQVRRAEAWLEAHVAEPITMEDLAAGVGISLRTIQHAFRRARQCTPRQFLRQRRLELAHQRLREAPIGATVTGIALECGFGHFGDFARAYKERFGESPSATLRRR
jgi:AraC-like DNA-binding protein